MSILVAKSDKSTDTFDHLFVGESLKLERVWDHIL